MNRPRTRLNTTLAAIALLFCASPARAAVYEVGPDAPLKSISSVPWAQLAAGDTVRIHWRPEPYREKWVICRRGTEARPIRVTGIAGPAGELPVIDGDQADTAAPLRYWGGERSVIKIGGAAVPADAMPAHIILEKLAVIHGRPPFTFHGAGGPGRYAMHAAGIWVEKGEHITVRGCELRDDANGLFVSCGAADVVVEDCRIGGNGMEKSVYEHNIYTEAAGMIFQNNDLAPLRAGCPGNNLKDRSAGLVVRGNRIEGGNRELDLVDAEDSAALRARPDYRQTFVYGNTLIEPAGDGNSQIVHYGGDSAKPEWYRKGTLFFYGNTVISRRTDATTLFRLASNDERVVCVNNIFYTTAAGSKIAVTDSAGKIELGKNWLKPGWRPSRGMLTGTVEKRTAQLETESPGFVSETDAHLAAQSPCLGAGDPLPEEISPDFREMPGGSGAGNAKGKTSRPNLGALGEKPR